MNKKIVFIIFASVLNLNLVFGQSDTILLNTIEISSHRTPAVYSESARVVSIISRKEIELSPAKSVNQLLESALNLDIRQRGADEVQADVNSRTGSFEQTLIMLNGIKINDPQSGHHNLNLPIALEDVERIEILEGPGARVYGANAFSGAINIITKQQNSNFIKLRASGGSYGYLNGGFSTAYKYNKFRSFLSMSRKLSSGYITNTDFMVGNMFYQLENEQDFGTFNLQVGYKDKSFGAQSFYTPKYPNQFEQTKTTFGSLNFEHKGKIRLKQNIYWRRNQDRFELFRNNPASWYTGHNYHLTDVYGAEFNASYSWKVFRSAVGMEYRSENILSNVLGKDMDITIPVPGEPLGTFTKKDQRNTLSFFAEEGIYTNKFTLSAGAMLIYYSDFKWKSYGGIDASYQIFKGFKAYASANQSLRLPSFTDLYYQGPTNIGNPNLVPEQAITYEGGIKYFYRHVQSHIGVYKRFGKNIIDWVKLPTDEKWQSMNLTEITTSGIEGSLTINKNNFFDKISIEHIDFNFSYNTSQKSSGNYISNYALDFLKSKISLGITNKIFNGLTATWQLLYQDRNGSYTSFDFNTNSYGEEVNYAPFTLFNAQINYAYRNWSTFASVENALGKQYYDLGNVVMPGRWIKAGLSYKFEF